MINYVYQLVRPHSIAARIDELDTSTQGVLVRPTHLAICHADQRYYRGERSPEILKKKLPMALIHEACGVVVDDREGHFKTGDRVILLPNIPGTMPAYAKENYRCDSVFRSSGCDGFMQEYLFMPHDRLVSAKNVPDEIAAITEFISVAFEAVTRFIGKSQGKSVDEIAVWGDGSMGYCVGCVIKNLLPDSRLTVIGQNPVKLGMLSFADRVYSSGELPDSIRFNHAFECTGGQGCVSAFGSIIRHIEPEGCIMMLGVSETPVPINTRDCLEKGLTLVGSSRSDKHDFEGAVSFLSDSRVLSRLSPVISDVICVSDEEDIRKAFDRDIVNLYKTVMDWRI